MKIKPRVPESPLEVEEEVDDGEVSVTYDIASYPSDLTLSVVQEMWRAGDIVIPDFQRNFVWSIKQASLLIESFMLGLPVPQVFFYVDETNKNQVIDGQQRITSIVYFLEGYFGTESIQGKKQVFRLTGLNEKSPFLGKRFQDLPDSHQRKLKGAVLRAINIRQLNPEGQATSIYHIFERLNTGGTPLKPQEIRNCVFRGPFVAVIRKLNQDKNWRLILGKKTYDRHQKDVELVLRVFAMAFFLSDYEKPMKEFLNVVMKKQRVGTSESVARFIEGWPKITESIVRHLGNEPFHLRGPLNSSVLDAVMCTLISAESALPKDLRDRFDRLIEDDDFKGATTYSTSDSTVITKRFQAARRHLVG